MRIVFFLIVCAAMPATARSETAPITSSVWTEAVVSVTDLDRSAEFFESIGGYEQRWRGQLSTGELQFWGVARNASAESLLLGRPGEDTGLVRLVRFDNAGRKVPTRPGARAWDTGCYFSLMVRMKDIDSIYDDAIRMGWWTETPIADLSFGTSKLKVVIFRGPDGLQVQGYERLSPPLPDTIPEFERMTRPFNVMQMVRDRDASYRFFTETLGFDTFYNGNPYVADKPEPMPLGIPINLTTTVRYRAGIVYPVAGEFGRMEMIEVMDLDGIDYADRCDAPNLGILAVRFPVDDMRIVNQRLVRGGIRTSATPATVDLRPWGLRRVAAVKTPDGANIQFLEPVSTH